MTNVREVWERQLANVNTELDRIGAVIEIGNQKFVDPTVAGAKLTDLYGRLVSTGYANGWV